MKRKQPLTLDQHQAIGVDLACIRDRLTAIVGDLSGRYTAGTLDHALASVRKVDTLRIRLDVQAQEDVGDRYRSTIYYPNPEQRSTRITSAAGSPHAAVDRQGQSQPHSQEIQ